ncbi:MAG: aldo/keto reductase [Pseudomonadales bacterium]|jgi:aryl-alcohol dehydrogenase-like predicted oxidoreductase|nr:aldo/keto reductase [Pseudomonadales bacterium]
MEYKRLGQSGLKVSLVGLGCNNFGRRCDEDATTAIVHAALDQGINFFDTADIYGGAGQSEKLLGKAIKGLDRSQLIVATKFANPMGEGPLRRGAARGYIVKAVEDSLRRLDTEYIDLYQQHVPDADTPIEETIRALDDLIRLGKVRYIGNSNFTGWQIADADWTAKSLGLNSFSSAQNLYNLLDQRVSREVIPACERFQVGLLPYFPLASGMLTGKYLRGEAPDKGTRLASMGERGRAALTDAAFDRFDQYQKYAQDAGRSILELAMSWLARQDVVSSVIAGATSAMQVKQNVEAAQWSLSKSDLFDIGKLS